MSTTEQVVNEVSTFFEDTTMTTEKRIPLKAQGL